MRAPASVRVERFQQILEHVAFESSNGSTIIVEGQKDRESLRKLGIGGPIECLQSSRRNAAGFVESLYDAKEVIVLTDFDREGISLAKKLSRSLEGHAVHANLVLWRRLRELTRSEVRSIEELPKYLERLQDQVRNPNRKKHREAASDFLL